LPYTLKSAREPFDCQSDRHSVNGSDIVKNLIALSSDSKLDPGGVAFTYVSLISLFFFVPFAAVELFQGRLIVALIELALIALIIGDFVGTRYRESPAVPRWIFMSFVVAADLYMFSSRGLIGIYWAYPVAICLHLALNRRHAFALNMILLAGIGTIALMNISVAETARILATLFLTSTFAFLFSTTVREERRKLEEQVVTDSLTGAYNRRHLDKRLAETLEQRTRHEHTASIVLFDLDHFKRINDRHGHHVGDRVLRTVIETIKTRVRVVDQVFRYGGEEFVVLLPDTNLKQAEKLAIDITSLIASLHMIEGGPVTISCGVAELIEKEDPLSWMDRCDRALYCAKKLGRNRVCTTEDVLLEQRAMYRAAGI